MFAAVAIAVPVIVAGGAYLRWACRPLTVAYWVGREVARSKAR